MTPECERLSAFVDGELSPEEAERFRDHLASCGRCPAALEAAVHLEAIGAPKAKVLRPRFGRRAGWIGGGLTVAALAAALIIALRAPPAPPPEVWSGLADARLIEPRLSHPGAGAHRPLRVLRSGTQASPLPFDFLARLEREGDRLGIAEAYLARGNPEAARPYLEGASPSAGVLSTRAALEWMSGHPEDALRSAAEALELEPDHRAARWNEALALRELGLSARAAAEFDAVAASGEPGWSDEARAAAGSLRETLEAQQRTALDSERRCREMAQGGPVLEASEASARPRQTRVCFLDALRTAATAERLDALAPLAAAFDQRAGNALLAGAIATVRKADPEVRAPLAAEYAKVPAGNLATAQLQDLARRAVRAGQPDIALGALFFVPTGELDVEEYARLAAAQPDPWYALAGQEKRAEAELQRGAPLAAVQRLAPLADRCSTGQLQTERCVTLEGILTHAYEVLSLTAEAHQVGLRGLARARLLRDRGLEQRFLQYLGQIARIRGDAALTHAYLGEALARDPSSCPGKEFVHNNLAMLHQRRVEFDEARQEIDAALGCPTTQPLARALVLSDLARSRRAPGDAEALQRALAMARQSAQSTPGERALATEIEGRFTLETDAASGSRLLHEAIDQAQAAPAGDEDARRARFYSFTSLILDATRRSDWQEAAKLVAGELGAPELAPCSLAIASDDERLAALARGPDGTLRGVHDGARKHPVTANESLVPGAALDALKGCAEVSVIARPPLQGRVGLLPRDWAWSYRVGGATPPRPSGPAKRVVVANVTPPPELRLPPLRSPPPSIPPSTPTERIEGPDATPERVLAALRDASEVEVHTHGLVDLAMADASYLALSPDSKGRFALTAGDLRGVWLARGPVVVLAACRAGETTPYLHRSYGLPTAFVAAGATAVFAATGAIPDADVAEFFESILARIRGGQSPAVALRDVRRAWENRPDGGWVDAVLLFE